MAARGAESKEYVMQKILATFPDAFKYDKEIRIPVQENGETIQIKCVLTAAKTNVEYGGDTAMPGAKISSPAKVESTGFPPVVATKVPTEPTEEEKKHIVNMLDLLGL